MPTAAGASATGAPAGDASSSARRALVPVAHTGARVPALIVTPTERRRLLAAVAKAGDWARWPPAAPIAASDPRPHPPPRTVLVPPTRVPHAVSHSLISDADADADADSTPRADTARLQPTDPSRVAERAPTIDTLLPSGTGSLFDRTAQSQDEPPGSVQGLRSAAAVASSSREPAKTRSADTLGSRSDLSGTAEDRSSVPPLGQTADPPPPSAKYGNTAPEKEPTSLQPDPDTLARFENKHSAMPSSGEQSDARESDSSPPGALLRQRGSGRNSFMPAALANGVPYTDAAAAAAAAASSSDSARSPATSPAHATEVSRFSTSTASRSIMSHGSDDDFNRPSDEANSSPKRLDSSSGAEPASATIPEGSADSVTGTSVISSEVAPEPPKPPPSLPASAWAEVQDALDKFRQRCSAPSNAAAAPPVSDTERVPMDKAGPLRSVLLPFLTLELERPGVYSIYVPPGTPSNDPAARANAFVIPENRRAMFFEWVTSLLAELPHVATSGDRGAILESLACLLESENLSAAALNDDSPIASTPSISSGSTTAVRPARSSRERVSLKMERERYNSLLSRACEFAIGEMNKKGVYQNTLIFSGRVLAIAFFRIEGVAGKLLSDLPIKRWSLDHLAVEAGWPQVKPQTEQGWDEYLSLFPVHLRPYCFRDCKSYLPQFEAGGRWRQKFPTPGTSSGSMGSSGANTSYLIDRADVKVEMGGNWLRRWKSDDSELFFSFCRNFHRQLGRLLYGAAKRGPDPPISKLQTEPRMVFGVPGFAHINTSIHQKCLSLVQRELMSVTTLSSQKSPFNAGETANVLVGSTTGKPRNLDLANRRCSAVVVDSVKYCGVQGLIFLPMVDTQIKTLFRRTSLWDVQGVFCLLDWTDSLFAAIEAADWGVDEVVDLSFVLDVVEMLLEKSDHAVTLMRTIAFAYSNFALLIASKTNRMRFVEGILLKTSIFQKLFLSWSFLIRAYFLHLLVFRLGHLTDFPAPPEDPRNSTAMMIAQLFNHRLDEVRERHDELSPDTTESASDTEEDEADEPDTRSRRRLSFVSTIKRTHSIERSPSPDSYSNFPASSDDEDVLAKPEEWDVDPQYPSVKSTASRAAKWLRSMRKTKSGGKGALEPRAELPPTLTGSTTSLQAKERDAPVASDPQPDDSALRRATSSPTLTQQPSTLRRRSSSSSDRISFDATFDLQTAHTPTPAAPGGPAPGRPSSVRSSRVSRAFSKRSSLVPGPALDLVAPSVSETDSTTDETSASGSERQSLFAPSLAGVGGVTVPASAAPLARIVQAEPRYAPNLHVYAVQSLREYEQTIHEHDEFMSSQPEGERSVVPQLPVNWPALWNDPN